MARPTGTQTRTFNYIDPATSKPGVLLRSATNPENGTVTYTYDSSNRLWKVTDAKNQQKVMTYDSLSRVIQVQRYYYQSGSYVEDTMQRTNFSYDTNPYSGGGVYSQNIAGRLAAVQYYGGNCSSYGTPHTGCDTIQEWYTYDAPGAMLGKKVIVTRGSNVQSLTASWTVDSEGRPSSVTYPSWKTCLTCTTVPGSSYAYAYDTMGRLNTMTDTVNSRTMISGVTYGVANEMQQMTSGYTAGVNTETRSYNGMFQLTQLTVGSALSISYAYSATQNNGKITSQTDALSGEQVLYTYDSLNRLASAQTAGSGGWGQSYTYDGFGNLTDQTLIKGSAPDVHVAYNYLTNLQTGDTADANGNIGAGYNYDMENRLVQPGSSSTARYAYDAANKRVWRGDTGVDEITFWAGQKLATYQISTTSGLYFTLTSTNVYFGSKLISKGTYNSSGTGDKVNLTPVAADRLGSIGKFYPYGTERPSATANDTEKFTGYFRDAATGLDYADQRYEQPGMGRFMTPDSAPSAKAADPGSWNRYAYVGGDPINRVDPTGQYWIDPGYGPILIGDPGAPPLGGVFNGSICDYYCSAGLAAVNAIMQGVCNDLRTAFADGSTDYWLSQCGNPPVQNVANVPCDQALTLSIQSFLLTTDAPLLTWDPNLAADLVSEGASVGIDPRLMASIATVESDHGRTLKNNNPFGLNDAVYSGSSSAIRSEGRTLNRMINGNGWGIPEMYSGQPGHYCVNTPNVPCSPGPVSDILRSFVGNPLVGLKPGNPNSLGYPCPQ